MAKNIDVLIDDGTSNECLYTNGQRWEHVGEVTVYACDIAEACGDEPSIVRHHRVFMGGAEWPEELNESVLAELQGADDA
ncbi:MAG: hypothetical protein B7733_12930 [Myxococcales bacterium FL481]|nr:MAG: hypothetical protein B7733_12930 [Myxococcales bacterium FL481]